MTSTYIIIGLAGIAVSMGALVWVCSKEDSNLEYQPALPKVGKVRGSKRFSDKYIVRRTIRWIEASPQKRIAKSVFNKRGGWTATRRDEFLKRHEHIFGSEKIGNATYVFLK